jgi:hypothetical protein
MNWAITVSGFAGAFLLALGSDMILPVNGALGGLCDLGGVASTVVFFGLVDGK